MNIEMSEEIVITYSDISKASKVRFSLYLMQVIKAGLNRLFIVRKEYLFKLYFLLQYFHYIVIMNENAKLLQLLAVKKIFLKQIYFFPSSLLVVIMDERQSSSAANHSWSVVGHCWWCGS